MTQKKPPTVVIADTIFDVEATTAPFGKRWGTDKVTLSREHLDALQAGKLLAVDVMSEYVVFLALEHPGEVLAAASTSNRQPGHQKDKIRIAADFDQTQE